MKGILLAGGYGTRLHPMTTVLSKQLVPVYDKPMIYYSLTTLMLAGLRDILIISTPDHLPLIRALLDDGSRWGIRLSYAAQKKPDGLPQAFVIGEEFLQGGPAALILGDSIFHGDHLPQLLKRAKVEMPGATTFVYHVQDPSRFGIVQFAADCRTILSIEEKPSHPKSNWAMTGLFLYDGSVPERARTLKPSIRGETEIADLNNLYHGEAKLQAIRLGRGIAWLDMGTPEALLEASQFVHALERRQGLKIACPEEVALNVGFIDRAQFAALVQSVPFSGYQKYLRYVLDTHEQG